MIYSTISNTTLRTRFLRWTPPLLLSVACCTLISHQISLSELTQRLVEQADSTDLQHLEDRVMGLELSILNAQQSPNAVTRTEMTDLSAALNGRITDIEKAMAATHQPQTDLQALLQRVLQLESGQKQLMHLPVPNKPAPLPRKPKKPAEPSFQILGWELRGGERFLSIVPVGTQSLDQSRLMRIGESYAGWRLEGFDEQSAVFVADGVTHRLNIR
ncbi:hypothetical protein [Pseudomonas sp. QTF5]|uniref:hypothetical protein n=1 Tax=Pseudomonas sp. QTF5 TaxID=1435425 RepID=UPI000687AEEE|nr:hypothetical protein [Pseudomonas sp. QTF5]